MSFSRCLDIWGLIGEMRSHHRPGLQTQSTRYASGVLALPRPQEDSLSIIPTAAPPKS